MRKGSHTGVTARPVGLRLVASVEERSLSERLAGSVSEQLGLFADRMREGLLAASVAIGLEVMDRRGGGERAGRAEGEARR